MTSNGGVATPATARRFPVRLIESGPAAGALMSSYLSQHLTGRPHVLSFDMGGTTAKGSLIRDRLPLRKYDLEVARVHAFKKGSGLPLKIPVIDMIEIGAGGGGIAAVDRRGVIQLGPRSAGADPGPACYGRNGRDATLTDANLVLGYLDPAFFLGGKMRLDPERAAERDSVHGRQDARPASRPRRLGDPRDGERGRGAGLSRACGRARLRLSRMQHDRLRRLRSDPRHADRAQAEDTGGGISRRRRRHVGVRPAGEPAEPRDHKVRPSPARRHRRPRSSRPSSRL